MRQNHGLTRLWQSPVIRQTRQMASPGLWYRQLTSHRRPLPRFIIAGAQKAGTTSLFGYLVGHPQCAASLTKEVHYFDRAYQRGTNWYRTHFPVLGNDETVRACFESSPYYMFDPRVPSRVRELLPNVKLIFLLRNPVSRAYSHYQHSVRRGREKLAFADALEAEPARLAGERARLLESPFAQSNAHRFHSYVARGHYAEQLDEWLKFFRREQMLVVQAERMFKQPREVFAQVLDFLELESWAPDAFGSHNCGRYTEPMSADVRQRLGRQFAEPNARLFDLLGVRYDWQ